MMLRQLPSSAQLLACMLLLSSALVGAVREPRDPTSPSDALKLFESATMSGEILQASRAMSWIRNNYEAVLQAPELDTLLPECVMQVLSQSVLVHEIEVFRAVRRIIEAQQRRASGNSSSPHPQIPRNVLLSTVRLLAIDPQLFHSEVVTSGLVPHSTVVQVLLKMASKRVPAEYTRESAALAFVAPRGVNVLGPKYGSRMAHGSDFSLSPDCRGRNPLVNSTTPGVENATCWLDTYPSTFVTIELGHRFLINHFYIYVPAERRCTNMRVEMSSDGHHFTHIMTLSTVSAYVGSSFSLREVSVIRFRVEGSCAVNSSVLRVNAIKAYYS